MQAFQHHLVQGAGEIEDLIASGADLVALGQAHGVLEGVGTGIVDAVLALGHVLHILFQGDLAVLGGVEDQQIPQKVLVPAVLVADAALEMDAEVFEEFLVLGLVVPHQLFQLALDLLLQVLADDLQLAVMLENFPGNVQGQVGRVHHALDKVKVVVHQLVAFFHDHHAVGVQGDAALVVAQESGFIFLAGDE